MSFPLLLRTRGRRLLILLICLLFIIVCVYSILVNSIIAFDGCACGHVQRLETLGRWSGNRFYFNDGLQNSTKSREKQSLVPVDDIKPFTYSPDNVPPANYKELQTYAHNVNHQAKYLRHEYLAQVKKDMYMAVMTSEEYLPIRAKTLYETWGKEVDNLFFYVGEDCVVPDHLSHLPIVKLKGISDREYPPLRKAFAVLQYMYDHHLEEYNWFVRADDDMYVRTKKLTDLLRRLNPYENIYLGRAGTGRKEHVRDLRLLPHEKFCMGGPGIFLSAGAMIAAGPHLKNCLNAVLYHNNHSRWKWDYDDVEIGRCLSRKINIQCSSSLETRKYFVYDYFNKSLDSQSLWTTRSLRDIITLHPVKDPNNMKSIHHFYQTIEFKKKQREQSKLAGYLNELCKSLPSSLLPPHAKATCHLKPSVH